MRSDQRVFTTKEIINLVYYDSDLGTVPVKTSFDFSILKMQWRFLPVKPTKAYKHCNNCQKPLGTR